MENLDKINEILKNNENCFDFTEEEEEEFIKCFFKEIENPKENKEELKKIFFESIDKNYLYIINYIPLEDIFNEDEIINLLKSEIKNQEIKEEVKNQVFSIIKSNGAEYKINFFKKLFEIQEILEDDKLISTIIDFYSFIELGMITSSSLVEIKEQKIFADKIVELLIEKENINLNVKGETGNTLLYGLINSEPKNMDLIRILFKKENLDLTIENCCNDTVLDTISLNIASSENNNENNEEIISMIIEKAKKNGQINNLLFSAIKNNKVNTIETLINYKPSLNNEFDYYNAFYLAINSNNQEIIKLLKTEYNKLSEIDNNQMITKLFEDEKNIRLCYEYIENKDYKKTLELIKNINDLNLIVDGTTLLHKIVSLNEVDTLFISLILKQNNINLNIKDLSHLTPFELAVKNNNFKIAFNLLKYPEKIKVNLDVNKVFYYVCKNNSNIMLSLIKKLSLPSPDLTLRYEKNQSLLHIVCSNKNNKFSLLFFDANESLKLLKKLLDDKSNIDILNEKDEDGFTPLHLAIINDNVDIVKYLLKREDIDLLIEDFNGLTPLNLAAENGNFNIFKNLYDIFLKKKSININDLFYHACKSKNYMILDFLISQNNLDLSFKYTHDQNLLHIVCSNKNYKDNISISFELIKLLLNNDINVLDLNVPDINGDTPLDLAIKNGNLLTTNILIRRMNIENQDVKNLKLVKEENKIYLLRNICIMGDFGKFSLLYNKEYLEKKFDNPIFYFELLKYAYINNNRKIISKLEENLNEQIANLIEKTNFNDVINVLSSIVYNINNPNLELFNKISKKIENPFIKFYIDIIYCNKDLKEINKLMQGENQVAINRKIDEDERTKEIYLITDTAYGKIKEENNKINQNEILYKSMRFNNDLVMIDFYKKGSIQNSEENKLVSASIDKEGIIKFDFYSNKNLENLEKEINKILNNNYLDTRAFDNTLSFLTYALIQLKNNEENIIIKVNCNLETITDTLKNSLEDTSKTYICDFNIDNHNVQAVIYEGKINIINTGYNFGYLHKDIVTMFNKKYTGDKIEINEIKSIEQLGGNCVLASKLYLESLITKNTTKYKRLINAIKKWQNIYKKQELDNNSVEDNIDNIDNMLNSEEEEDLKKVLSLNNEILEDNKKHFLDNNLKFNKLKEFLKLKEILQQIIINNQSIMFLPNNNSNPVFNLS